MSQIHNVLFISSELTVRMRSTLGYYFPGWRVREVKFICLGANPGFLNVCS